jgi:hypothetical protein
METFKWLIPALLKLFHEIGREGTLPHTLYEVNVTLIPKPNKDATRGRERQRDLIISLMILIDISC